MTELTRDFLAAALPTATIAAAVPPSLDGTFTDTRAAKRGALFVALVGDRFDAHAFVADALRAGAGAAVVEAGKDLPGVPPDAPLIVVEDALKALQDLAAAHLARLPARRVGLTGSNGKTTTKELVAAALRAVLGDDAVLATEGNLNNHVGLPLTALRAHAGHRALVLEMGMNHLGEIATLAAIAKPHVGLITNIGTAHAGNVGGIEGVARAKAELFEALGAGDVAVVNADDPRAVREAQTKAKCRHVSFGRAAWADVRLASTTTLPEGGMELGFVVGGAAVTARVPLEGRHNAVNAAGALAVAVALGLDVAAAAAGLAQTAHAKGRLARFTLGGDVLVLDDTYNANPDSMEAGLEALVELAGPRRKVAALGQMLELGEGATAAHRHIGASVAQHGVVALYACGDLGKHYGEGAIAAGLSPDAFVWAQDSAALAPLVAAGLNGGDAILIKGSRGARMEVVVDALKKGRVG